MEAFIGFLIGLLVLFLVVKLFAWPIKNIVTALIAGILGIPGVLFLIIFTMFM